MTFERWGPPIALMLTAITLVIGIAALAMKPELARDDMAGIPFFAFGLMGGFVAARQPRNPVGWLFMIVGGAPVLGFFSATYAMQALIVEPGSLPVPHIPAWISSWAWIPGIATLLTFCMLLYPNGRLPSRRWRPVLYGTVITMALAVGGIAFAPGKIEPFEEGGPTVDNPFGIEAAEGVLGPVSEVAFVVLLGFAALSVLSLGLRFRSSSQDQRQQMKWFMYPAGVLITVVLLEAPIKTVLGSAISQFVFITAILLLPLGTGVGILKYRLFDIDVVINRTLVYLSLTAILVGTYLGIVVLLQQGLSGITNDSDVAVAASTLAVAAMFRPLRSRVQTFIDQRFYRRKYDAVATLAHFSARLPEQVDLNAVNAQVLGVVTETIQPAHASLWLKPRSQA